MLPNKLLNGWAMRCMDTAPSLPRMPIRALLVNTILRTAFIHLQVAQQT